MNLNLKHLCEFAADDAAGAVMSEAWILVEQLQKLTAAGGMTWDAVETAHDIAEQVGGLTRAHHILTRSTDQRAYMRAREIYQGIRQTAESSLETTYQQFCATRKDKLDAEYNASVAAHCARWNRD